MIFALVVVISVLTISGAAPASDCQRNCINLTIPSSQCFRAFTDIQQFATRMFANQRAFIGGFTDCDRDTMNSLLNIFCSPDCLSSFVTYRLCTRSQITQADVNTSLTLACIQHSDGTFCPVKVLEAANGDPLIPTCARGGRCNSTCQQSYRNLSSTLGCCGSSWFDNPLLGSFSNGVLFFDFCNVALDGPCQPASGAGVLYLSMMLVVAASLLSTIIV